MVVYRVNSREHGSIDLPAANWLIALGQGLEKLGIPHSPDRIACERLVNGTVLVRDVRTGAGFSVQEVGEVPGGPPEEEHPTLSPPIDAEEDGSVRPLDEEDVGDLDSDHVSPLDLVADAAASIRRAMDVDAALALAVSAGVRLTRSRGGSALLCEPAGLRFRYVVGEQAHRLRGMRIPAGVGVAGYAVNNLTSLIVQNAYDDPRFYRNVDRHTGYRTRSLLVVPLAAGERSLGCLELVDPLTGFSDSHLAEMETLAEAAAERILALPRLVAT